MIYLILINLVTPKARAKHEPFVQQTHLWLLAFLSNRLGKLAWDKHSSLLDPLIIYGKTKGLLYTPLIPLF